MLKTQDEVLIRKLMNKNQREKYFKDQTLAYWMSMSVIIFCTLVFLVMLIMFLMSTHKIPQITLFIFICSIFPTALVFFRIRMEIQMARLFVALLEKKKL